MSYLIEGVGYIHIFDLDGAITALKKAKLFVSYDADEKVLCFYRWRWEDSIFTFADGKIGPAMEALKVIAPFVEPGCYVQMAGESADVWRWVFDGKTVREILPQWPKVRLHRRAQRDGWPSDAEAMAVGKTVLAGLRRRK